MLFRKLFKPIAGLVVLSLLCSGCSFSKDPQSYMRPPKLPDNQANLMQVIQQALPGGAALIRPKHSKDMGSIYLKDLNNDGKPVAVVFYQTGKDARIHGMLWQWTASQWTLLDDFQGEGYELDTLLFEDVTGDGKMDLIAGYSSGARLNKGLVIYQLKQQKLMPIYEAPYSEMAIDDLNQDNKKDITLITLDRGTASQAVTLQYDQSFKTIGTVNLDPNINGYEAVRAGWIAEGKRGLAVHYGLGAHSSSVQLLLFQQGELVKAFTDRNVPFNPRSIVSGDLNKDGIMEIGLDYAPRGAENEPHATMPYITAYYRWNGHDDLDKQPLYERYIDYVNSFYFDIPAAWKDKFKVQRSTAEDQSKFQFISLTTGEPLIEWKTVPTDAEGAASVEWKEIGRTSKTVTLVRATADTQAYISLFHPISQIQEDSP